MGRTIAGLLVDRCLRFPCGVGRNDLRVGSSTLGDTTPRCRWPSAQDVCCAVFLTKLHPKLALPGYRSRFVRRVGDVSGLDFLRLLTIDILLYGAILDRSLSALDTSCASVNRISAADRSGFRAVVRRCAGGCFSPLIHFGFLGRVGTRAETSYKRHGQ